MVPFVVWEISEGRIDAKECKLHWVGNRSYSYCCCCRDAWMIDVRDGWIRAVLSERATLLPLVYSSPNGHLGRTSYWGRNRICKLEKDGKNQRIKERYCGHKLEYILQALRIILNNVFAPITLRRGRYIYIYMRKVFDIKFTRRFERPLSWYDQETPSPAHGAAQPPCIILFPCSIAEPKHLR